jgi:nucleotide-binding universal stress UspA family protein
VVVAITKANGPADAIQTIALSLVFIVFMFFAVRPFLSRLARYHEERGHLPGGMLALLFVAILLSALATDRIGIHAIFGAFLLGAIMPHRSEFISELVGKLEDFTVVFLLPLFFAFTGLRTDMGLLGVDGKLWLATGAVLVVAIVGKWGGSSLAARALKLPWRESMALGILMNTRGLTELIILNIGLDLGVIPPTLFAILVIMALVTTFMATPLLSIFYPRRVVEQMVRDAGDGEEAGEEAEAERKRYTILVPIAKLKSGPLVDTAIRLADGSDGGGRIILLRAVSLPGSAYRAGPEVQESLLARAAQGLRPLVDRVRAAGHEAVPLVLPSEDIGEAIVKVAKDRQPDLVFMAYDRPLFGRGILHTTVGDVLKRAPADVAVLVGRTPDGLKLDGDRRIVVPHGGGFHEDIGLDLALRLARVGGATVSVVGPAGDETEAEELAARASRAVEESGVWTVPESVESEHPVALLERTRDADLMVLGFGDEWVKGKTELGGIREAIAAQTQVPTLLVRRHGRTARLRRPREWIEGDGSQKPNAAGNGHGTGPDGRGPSAAGNGGGSKSR